MLGLVLADYTLCIVKPCLFSHAQWLAQVQQHILDKPLKICFQSLCIGSAVTLIIIGGMLRFKEKDAAPQPQPPRVS